MFMGHCFRGEILSDNKRGLMLPNGEAWRRWRKVCRSNSSFRFCLPIEISQVLHSGFHSRQAETYHNIQSLESAVLLHDLLKDPEDWERHAQR